MPTQVDLDAASVYASIMEEAKFRALSINTITGAQSALPVALLREFCFLQLRMLCELIALGCLVAHGDIEEAKALQKSYHAGDIVKRLEKLHPNFYPVPRKPIFSPGHLHMADYDGKFLTKEELLRLYSMCGDLLHKGSLRNLLNPKEPSPSDYQDIQNWGQNILNLLSFHTISRIGGNLHLVTALEAQQVGGNVLVSVAESPPAGHQIQPPEEEDEREEQEGFDAAVLHAQMVERIDELERALNSIRQPGIGHNHPPESLEDQPLTTTDYQAIMDAISVVRSQPVEPSVTPAEAVEAATTLNAIKGKVSDYLDTFTTEMVKAAGAEAGKWAIRVLAWGLLIKALTDTSSAITAWVHGLHLPF